MMWKSKSKLSVEHHEHIVVIGVRFDVMEKPGLAWLACGQGHLALVFDQTEFDIDLTQATYGVSYLGRRWRLDVARNEAGFVDAHLVGEVITHVSLISQPAALGLLAVAGYQATEFWYHYRIVLRDGRAFEFFLPTHEKIMVKQVERLRRRTTWRRRFKKWIGSG